ncbi:hypothetical protein [Bradyrhizobium sp.]|uniref:hypothetical protein n=1 Tax=Bradyrhizobium sp. TaxID=376 RepID=UPI0035249312
MVTVEPAEKLELVGVGLGVGLGVGEGVGVGVGLGDWACASGAAATASSKAIASTRKSGSRALLRPARVSFNCQGDGQRMKSNPEKERSSRKIPKSPLAQADLR